MRCTIAICLVAALAGCADKASKEEEEAAKSTFVCQLDGERIVIRFDAGEARMLMPGGDRVILYQVPSTSGVRFSNGSMELRGKGTDLTLIDRVNAVQTTLAGCEPYTIPKQP
jgi:membrane-bound inhibitor of C-type lysozyme